MRGLDSYSSRVILCVHSEAANVSCAVFQLLITTLLEQAAVWPKRDDVISIT